jgi:hypothetical protein
MARALIEQRRPWMVLRNTNTSKTVTTANTWQTARRSQVSAMCSSMVRCSDVRTVCAS